MSVGYNFICEKLVNGMKSCFRFVIIGSKKKEDY